MSRTLPKVLAPLMITLLIVAVGWRLWVSGGWERQRQNAFLLLNLDLPASEAVANEWLLVGNVQNLVAGDAACEQLWLSRSLAGANLEQAVAVLEDAGACDRADDYFGWAANLAWLQGDPESALDAWRRISDGKQLAWGIYQLRIDQHQKGRLLLADLAQDRRLTDVQRAQLDHEMGNSFHVAGDIEQAALHYLQAWELAGPSYRLAHELGKVMGRLDRCAEAVVYLEQGLAVSRTTPAPSLAADYFLELARCQQRLGAAEKAEAALEHVEQLLNSPAMSVQERETLRPRLEQLRETE